MNSLKTYSKRYTYPNIQTRIKCYSKQRSYFRVAKIISEMSTYKCHHIGCIAVLNHRIISSGYNSNKSDPLQKRLNYLRFKEDETKLCIHSSHAEVSCLKPLIGSGIDFSKVHLYMYRETKENDTALARPCKSCMKLIQDLGIRYIHYTGDLEFLKEDLKTETVYKLV